MNKNIVSFYCRNCELDADLDAEFVTTTIAKFFRARCPRCGRRLVRYRDNVANDPYYRDSKKLRRQRDELSVDLIQPNQEGFQMHYKKQWDKMQAEMEQAEERAVAFKKERDAYYKKAWYNINTREVAKKAIEAEDKIRAGGR